MQAELKKLLHRKGATVVGFAAVNEALADEISHLVMAVSIGVDRNLNEDTLKLLADLQKTTERFLRKRGYKFLSIPPDSDRINGTFVSKLYQLFSHKVAATCAGIGWVGRNGLLISPDYGPRLSLATVLTDAPIEPDVAYEECMCENCNLCVEHCPSNALTGEDWSREKPFPTIINFCKCRTHKENSRAVNGRPNCGLCINICPHGRKKNNTDSSRIGISVEEV